MKKNLIRIAKDTNFFLKKFIKKQKRTELISAMKYGLFSDGMWVTKMHLLLWPFVSDGCLLHDCPHPASVIQSSPPVGLSHHLPIVNCAPSDRVDTFATMQFKLKAAFNSSRWNLGTVSWSRDRSLQKLELLQSHIDHARLQEKRMADAVVDFFYY